MHLKVYKEMLEDGHEKAFRRPKNFSETKFANWVQGVYARFREILPELLGTLESAKREYFQGDADERDKASTADGIMGKIYNLTFCLSLSALVDIYTVYKDLTNLLQVTYSLYSKEQLFLGQSCGRLSTSCLSIGWTGSRSDSPTTRAWSCISVPRTVPASCSCPLKGDRGAVLGLSCTRTSER
jgi:hypothetical protein